MEMSITSKKGFWIGDLWATTQKMIDLVTKSGTQFSKVTDPDSGLSLLCYKTGIDDVYYDEEGREYIIDSASVCLIPLELLDDTPEGGHIFYGGGRASMEPYDEMFFFDLPSGQRIELS